MTDSSPADATSTYRCGVVVPPENPTVEMEMRALLPATMSLPATRLPVSAGTLEERLSAYNDALPEIGRSFGELRLDAIYLACTGSSYLVGPDGDETLATAMASGSTHALTATAAITRTLQDLGRRRIMLVSPYPDWLTERAVTHWTASGIGVAHVAKVPAPAGIYAIPDSEVLALLNELDVSDADAVLLSGTGMPTVTAIAQIGRDLGVPVLSSSLAAAHVVAQWARTDACLATDLLKVWG